MCEVGQKDLLLFDQQAYNVLPKSYVDVELSPLVPFARKNFQKISSIHPKLFQKTLRE